MRWTSNLTDTTGPFEGNHNDDAAHDEIESDTPTLIVRWLGFSFLQQR